MWGRSCGREHAEHVSVRVVYVRNNRVMRRARALRGVTSARSTQAVDNLQLLNVHRCAIEHAHR